MPLLRGKKNIGANIKELTEHGSIPRSHKQIVAIAMNAAGQGYANPKHSHPYSTNPSTTKGGKTAGCLICGQGREAHTIG